MLFFGLVVRHALPLSGAVADGPGGCDGHGFFQTVVCMVSLSFSGASKVGPPGPSPPSESPVNGVTVSKYVAGL